MSCLYQRCGTTAARFWVTRLTLAFVLFWGNFVVLPILLTKLGIVCMRSLAYLPLPVLRAIAWPLAAILFVVVAKRRRTVRTNLKLCLPQLHAQRGRWLEYQVFLRFSQSWLDRSWLFEGKEALLRERLRLHDPHGLLRDGKRTIFFGPHFMGMDAGWLALRLYCPQPMTSLYAPQKNTLIDNWFMQGRERFGHNLTVPRLQGFRTAVRFMRKEKGSMYLLPDMDFGEKSSIFVPFFGQQAATAPSLSRVARMANARVVPVLAFVNRSGYDIQVLPAWNNYPTDDAQADTLWMNQQLEDYILQHPEQYYWVHKRFKTRPPGSPTLYTKQP